MIVLQFDLIIYKTRFDHGVRIENILDPILRVTRTQRCKVRSDAVADAVESVTR